MNPRDLSTTELHVVAETAAKNYEQSVLRLLEILEVVEERKLYLEFGFVSLYRYCVEVLRLSSAVSYELIAVIHKSAEVPELKRAVMSGKVLLSKAKKICSVINLNNYVEWIDLAHSETSRVIEKCVAAANPKECVRASAED